MSDLVPASPKPLFKKAHELAKMVKQLNKISKKAVEVLEQGLTSEDERVRMIAAEKLLKFYMDSAEAQRADEIKAMLLDIKVNGLIGGGSTADDDSTPALDFDNISEEFRDSQVIDMGTVNKI
jgi:HEAT repeat protein